MDLVNVYRFQFKKREPILVAGLSIPEAIDNFSHEFSSYCDDEILSISLYINSILV